MLQAPVTGVQAWDRSTIGERWRVAIDDECQRELSAALDELRRNPVELLLLNGDSFRMPACAALMRRVQAELQDGLMFVVLDRLDLDSMSADEARKLYWILCSLMARPVAQRFQGTMTFDVLDRRVAVVPGSGIRPTVTNVDLTFHNDNTYGALLPDYISLLCLGTPLTGGLSKVASVYTVHNRLLDENRQALERLYRPFWYDRYREHAPGESGIARYPVFAYGDGRLEARIALPEIRAGYVLAGEAMDAETEEALDAVRQVFATADLAVEFHLERGQIEIVNNRLAVHSRSEFEDSKDESHRRHLVRLWLRHGGARSYTGQGVA
jgi:alpha-ketoglutarate-dependent taurine dioxygenase